MTPVAPSRAQTMTALFARLARRGGYPSETVLAKAFAIPQQTLHAWKHSKRQTAREREFLRAYAARHDCDAAILLERYALTPTQARDGDVALGHLLVRVRACVTREGPAGEAWQMIEAALDILERQVPRTGSATIAERAAMRR